MCCQSLTGIFLKVIYMKNLKSSLKISLVAALSVIAGSASAVDFTPLTGAFTAPDIVTAVLAISATLATIYVAIKGVRIVLAMLRGG